MHFPSNPALVRLFLKVRGLPSRYKTNRAFAEVPIGRLPCRPHLSRGARPDARLSPPRGVLFLRIGGEEKRRHSVDYRMSCEGFSEAMTVRLREFNVIID